MRRAPVVSVEPVKEPKIETAIASLPLKELQVLQEENTQTRVVASGACRDRRKRPLSISSQDTGSYNSTPSAWRYPCNSTSMGWMILELFVPKPQYPGHSHLQLLREIHNSILYALCRNNWLQIPYNTLCLKHNGEGREPKTLTPHDSRSCSSSEVQAS